MTLTILLIAALVFATWIALDGIFRHRSLCRLLHGERERRREADRAAATWRQTAIDAAQHGAAMTQEALRAWGRVNAQAADAIRYRRACEHGLNDALLILESLAPERAQQIREQIAGRPGQRTH